MTRCPKLLPLGITGIGTGGAVLGLPSVPINPVGGENPPRRVGRGVGGREGPVPLGVGGGVGPSVGGLVGNPVGAGDGGAVGAEVGLSVGVPVGLGVGLSVGEKVGF